MLDDLRSGHITERWQVPPPEGELMLDSSLFLPLEDILPLTPLMLSGTISKNHSTQNSGVFPKRAINGGTGSPSSLTEVATLLKSRSTTSHCPQQPRQCDNLS